MMDMTLGPVELIVLAFDGNNFNGEVAPALMDLVDRGIVRIIDIAVVIKDADGTAGIFEMQELSGAVAAAMEILTGEVRGLMSEADLDELANDMAPGTTIAAILCEHVWATAFGTAVRASGGRLVMAERIPGDVVDAARATLIALADAG